jgi:hypothetical protein
MFEIYKEKNYIKETEYVSYFIKYLDMVKFEIEPEYIIKLKSEIHELKQEESSICFENWDGEITIGFKNYKWIHNSTVYGDYTRGCQLMIDCSKEQFFIIINKIKEFEI